MKKKAIHAELGKGVELFDGWLTYEVTVQYEDGKTEKIPAYGKDLQDALRRVVHDEKVMKVKPIVDRIPPIVWVLSWFIVVGIHTAQVQRYQAMLQEWTGIIYVTGIIGLTVTVLSIRNWFKLRNK